jgi:antirestriction protein
MAINPEYVELEDGLQAVKLMARIHKDAMKANEVLEKIENGDMTHVSIDWLSKDVDVLGEPFATDIRPVEVSFIDNETRTPVCDACTIETKCEEKEVSCDCNGHEEKACTCEHGSTSEVTMTEEVVIEKSESNPIVEREFAAMKDKLAEMESVHKELTSTHEEALATIAKFEEAEEARKVELAKARVSGFVDAIINKEALLGKVDDETREERMKELNAWDEIKLEGFSIAMDSMPVPEETERTFGKGKSVEAEAKPEEVEAPETQRMFAMVDGRIVFNGTEENKEE